MTNETARPDSAASDKAVESSLYAKAEKIFPREVHGLFAGLRVGASSLLLGLFYGFAWLSWNGQQLVLFDLPARKFYILGLVFWPQDFFFMAIMLILAALVLFFVTAIAGRVWCGYACPQTVWTEIFLWFERKIEGNRSKQMKLEKAPMSFNKFRIKTAKHLAWLLFSLWTGFTFVGYFTPIRELWDSVFVFSLGPWETFWVFFYGFATYGNAGWMREQVCIYMCPYARFQSAMFDKDTLIVFYDQERGEARGRRKKSEDPKEKGLGDCIDCTICVQVCPTGIDIRDGLQYECIACAACIDACDDVMDQMGYEKGLIRYTTEHQQEGKKTSYLRPRIFIYIAFIGTLSLGLLYGLLNRVALDLDVIRDRNALYRETNEGLIENVYTVRFINMDQQAHAFRLTVSGIEGIQLDMDQDLIQLVGGEVWETAVRLRAPLDVLKAQSTRVDFHLIALDDAQLKADEDARFLGPMPGMY